MRQIRILIGEDSSGINKKISSLKETIDKKNDNSFIMEELRNLKKFVSISKNKNENIMAAKLSMLDSRLATIFNMVSSKIDSIDNGSKSKDEIKELIANNAASLMKKIEEKKKNPSLDKKLNKIENALEMALTQRPMTVLNTTINKGSNIVPFSA